MGASKLARSVRLEGACPDHQDTATLCISSHTLTVIALAYMQWFRVRHMAGHKQL